MKQNTQLSIDALLQRIEHVRGLARTLVKDAADADEIVAEALAKAVRRPVPLGPETDGWIATMLRNLVRDRARSARRRRNFEQAGARPERVEASSNVAAALERDRDVVAEVTALPEPYRSVVVMRFFDDLPPRKIAASRGVAVDTVNKQLLRGKQLLRERLEARYGDRGAWAVALLPVCGRDVMRSGAGLGISAWGIRAVAGVAALGVAGAGIAIWSNDEATSSERSSAELEVAAVHDESAAPETVEAPSVGAVESVRAPLSVDAEAVVSGSMSGDVVPATDLVYVTLVDLWGEPLANERVEWTAKSQFAQRSMSALALKQMYLEDEDRQIEQLVTDSEGRVSIAGTDDSWWLPNGWKFADRSAIVVGMLDTTDGPRQLLVANTVEVSGTVLDEANAPLEGVELKVPFTIDAISTLDLPRGATALGPGTVATSDSLGRFGPALVPIHPDVALQAQCETHKPARIRIPERDASELTIRLTKRPESVTPVIHGIVIEADGSPVSEATVRFGQDAVDTGTDGRFELLVSYWRDDLVVFARTADGRFAMGSAPSREAATSEHDRREVTIQMPPSMPGFPGILLNHDGSPAHGFSIHLLDATPMANVGATAELSPAGEWLDLELVTSASGAFRIPRMDDRAYTLLVRSLDDWAVHRFEGVRRSETVQELHLPALDLLDDLHGIVVDAIGTPVAGAEVYRDFKHVGNGAPAQIKRSEPVTTDTDGRFSFGRSGWRHLRIGARQPQENFRLFSDKLELGPERPRCPIVVQLDLHGWVRVQGGDDPGSWVELRDSNDALILTAVHLPGMVTAAERVYSRSTGGFGRLRVSQVAVELVHGRGEEVLSRIPISIRPNEQIEIDL